MIAPQRELNMRIVPITREKIPHGFLTRRSPSRNSSDSKSKFPRLNIVNTKPEEMMETQIVAIDMAEKSFVVRTMNPFNKMYGNV